MNKPELFNITFDEVEGWSVWPPYTSDLHNKNVVLHSEYEKMIAEKDDKLDSLQDKVYHSTRKVEELEHFIAHQNEKLQKAVEALEFYGNKRNWVFSKALPLPHIGITRMTIVEKDKDIGLASQGELDDVGGLKARKVLKEIRGS